MKINKILILLIFLLVLPTGVFGSYITLPNVTCSTGCGGIGNGNGYQNYTGYPFFAPNNSERYLFNYSGETRNIYLVSGGKNISFVEPIGFYAGTSSSYDIINFIPTGTLRYASVTSDGGISYVTGTGISGIVNYNGNYIYSFFEDMGYTYFINNYEMIGCTNSFPYTCNSLGNDTNYVDESSYIDDGTLTMFGKSGTKYFLGFGSSEPNVSISSMTGTITASRQCIVLTTNELMYFTLTSSGGYQEIFMDRGNYSNYTTHYASGYEIFLSGHSFPDNQYGHSCFVGVYQPYGLMANGGSSPDSYDLVDFRGHQVFDVYPDEVTPTPTSTPTPLQTACPTCTDEPHDIGDNELSTYFYNFLFLACFIYILAFVLTIGDKK